MKTQTSRERLKNIDIGVRRGAANALAEHKKEGVPIAIMENGKVVIIQPEDIVVPKVK